MNTTFRRFIAILLMLVTVFGMLPPVRVSAASDTSAVGELVDSYTANSQTFTLSENSRLFVVADTEPSGDLLQTVQLIQRQFAADSRPSGTPLDIVWGPETWIADGDIVIRLSPSAGIANEGYELEVTSTANVTAGDVRGLIYGLNMLHKHLRYADSNSIQGFTAADAPDTVQRAVSLDCGRKYYTKDWICNFIRQMSWMGYNTLQFHFSDDSGFRFDLWDEEYYTGQFQPKNDFSWICGSNYTSWTLSAYRNDADKGKYLTTAEVVEILETAAEYHIEVIPCFDSPSHLDYLTWSFEQHYDSDNSYSFYSTYDNKTYYAKDVNGIINYTNSRDWSTDLKWPYYAAVNVKGDLAKAFIFELYTDIAHFFKEYAGSTDMSVGADEVQLSTANLASGYSYAWGFPEFVDYINELNTLLNSLGYTMRMYNDFLGSTSYGASNYEFADNIEIQYWDSPFNPSASSNTNHTAPVSYYVDEGRILYNCIQTGTYYALRKTSSGSDARSVNNRQWTFYHANEEDIYNEWYSADISEHGDYSEDVADVPDSNLGGAYFLIWCDYACISTEQEIFNGCYDTSGSGEYYSLRDRMWSNITKMWNWDVNDTLDFEDFAAIRSTFGAFPGLGSGTSACSEPAVMPAATDPYPGYAGGCESYTAYCQVKITGESDLMTMPCTTETLSESVKMETANPGDLYTALRLYQNPEGQLWYKVNTKTGLVGYLRATDTEYVCALTDDITVTGATTPSAHVAGNYFLVQGVIEATENTLTSVSVYIHSGFGNSGEKVTGHTDTVTDNNYSLLNSDIDNNTVFDQVPTGNHTYVISAGYRTHYADGDTVVTADGTVNLVEEYFVVVSSGVSQSTCSHSYEKTVMQEATCTEAGLAVYSCGTCGHVYEEATEISGHSYNAETIEATCQDHEKVCYTCSVCGESYTEYAESAMSEWSETKPQGVDESLIQSKTMYRFSDYETVTSYETAVEGYEQTGSTWEQTGTGAVQYVNSWPSGFSTSSSLYAQYNQKANKVTAVSGDTEKIVINSDNVTGYLYYHWCYPNSYYSVASRSGSYTTFHAYYSTTSPSNYTCDTSDYSYKTSHSTCSNSDWFFVANVYTQSYATYKKLFTYGRWTDWSDWGEEACTAGTNRKVETQTMYRYVSGELGDHDWENSVCSLCDAVCEHTYQNNVCTSCGVSKPVMDYYLFGWINGADYACEDDAENLGEYKFEDGRLVVMFASDSYVAVKASDNENWYMTDGWQDFVSSATLYNTKTLGESANKLYVPGGHEVTFTLTDNGDDTYVLSYTSVACGHEKHSTEGICTLCGAAVEHSYDTTGYCSCGLKCEHSMENGYCTSCGAECEHVWENFVCTLCGKEKPAVDYYLFGWINGENYACEGDAANLGEYRFADGSLVVLFTSDSYVAVKASDNENWYMTDGWQDFVAAVTLYNTKTLGSDADKVFVPGGTEVTFTLVDNGDDTLTLSYVAVECPHESHGKDGACLACGDAVEHSYGTDGFCTCGLECDHEFAEGVCSKCEKICTHSYQNNVCIDCGLDKPLMDYYLFGSINGADYACGDDYENLGEYKFIDGTLVVFFTQASYVGVKASDNQSWYMTQEYVTETSATLYRTTTGAAEKMLIPGGMKVTFTLTDNGDDTYVLSYAAVECPHESHDTSGICAMCGRTVDHGFKDGWCDCGLECSHSYLDGVCSICGLPCEHSWDKGQCGVCGMLCDHEWENSVCAICSLACGHSWSEGHCGICEADCGHQWKNGICEVCSMVCKHDWAEGMCAICAVECGHSWTDGECTVCGELCEHDWTDGNCNVCGLTCGHSYADGICSTCGMTEPKPVVTAKNATLTLEDEVSINIYFTVENMTADTANMGLLAWDSEPATPAYDNAEYRFGGVSLEGERYKVTTDPIAAKNMGDSRYYMTYVKQDDGSYVYSQLFTYSPLKYVENKLTKVAEGTTPGLGDLEALCVALLNYGAEAQKYFASTTDYTYTTLMNADLTDAQKAYVEAYREDMVPAVVPAEASKVGSFGATANSFTSKKATVTLGGALAVNFYLKPSVSTDGMTMYYWSAADYAAASVLTVDNATGTYEMALLSDGRYLASVENISAKNMADTVYVCGVYEVDGVTHSTGVIAYSIGKYCVNKAAAASDVQNLAQATAVYGYYAKAYFNK